MVVAGTADVGMQDRCAVRGVLRRPGLEPILEDGGDALVIERADLDRAAGDRFRTVSLDAAIEAQDAEAGPEALFRMGPAGQHGDDQRLGVGADGSRLALEAFWGPLGVEPVRTWHVVRQGAMTLTAITSGVGSNTLAAMEHLHSPLSDARLDLLADRVCGTE